MLEIQEMFCVIQHYDNPNLVPHLILIRLRPCLYVRMNYGSSTSVNHFVRDDFAHYVALWARLLQTISEQLDFMLDGWLD